jgi:hypothetical protein
MIESGQHEEHSEQIFEYAIDRWHVALRWVVRLRPAFNRQALWYTFSSSS